MPSLPPPGPSSAPLDFQKNATAPGSSLAKGPNRAREANRGADAAVAQREAMEQTAAAHKRVQQAQIEANSSIDQIKDEYVKQSEAEMERNDRALEAERLKGYQAIRDLQRAQQAELKRIKSEGERQISQSDEYYKNTAQAKEHEGKQRVTEIEARTAREIESERKSSVEETEVLKTHHAQRIAQIQEDQNTTLEAVTQASHDKLEQTKENALKAQADAQAKFTDRYQNMVAQNQAELDQMNLSATQKLNAIRSDTTQKLEAYGTRQEDPFYQLLTLGAELEETADAYVLRAKVPTHEQDHVRVTVRGNQLVVSGNRRNEERQVSEPGHEASTSSFQSYSETFPLGFPVDARRLSRRFEGENLIVELPKLSTYTPPPTYHAKRVEKARAERPNFPSNLPATPDLPPAGKSKPLT